MPTAKEIAEALLAAPHIENPLSDASETWAPFMAYREAKVESGAPLNLEAAVIAAASCCADAEAELREYLTRAQKEAHDALADLAAYGSRVDRIWFALDRRQSAERLNERMKDARYAFRDAVAMWAALADRIVATLEETAAKKAAREERRALKRRADIATWCNRSKADLVKAAADRLVPVPYLAVKEEIATALVDAGHRP